MKRDDVLRRIAASGEELHGRHGVASLSIFGSFARDKANEDSDVDVLVEFSESIGLIAFGRLQDRLEEILGRSVDLVTPTSRHHRLEERILREAIRAA